MKNNKEATLKEWGELLDKMGLNDVSTTKINIARILDSDASRLINEEMSKERYNQIIDEVYENYLKEVKKINPVTGNFIHLKYPEEILSKEEFTNKCKTDPEFSEKWGLKIEERELSGDERFRIAYKNLELRVKLHAESAMLHYPDGHNKVMDDANVPTKLITLTYNNETIEVYE